MQTNTMQGLRENWLQFTLLVIINAFVGGMVGLERSILPEIASVDFGMDSKTAILSFIIVFGVTKALANYYTGRLANKWGRKNLLVIGWLFALPIPLLLIFAANWNYIIFANVLLGINQGLCWSSTVVMKIDLVGQKDRGLAMGLNEFSGYLAVGLVTFFTAYIADQYGLRPYPFYLGIAMAILGLLMSMLFIKDTAVMIHQEKADIKASHASNVFYETTIKNKNLSSTTQAGLVNNLNDGMIWGLLPMLLLSKSISVEEIGLIAGIYPAVWGLGQLFTGKMADHYNHRKMLFNGMLLQGIAICVMVYADVTWHYMVLCAILGLGTAIVYPTFLVVVAENTTPQQRPESIGVFRLWRDLGYAIGALLSGIIADAFGINVAIMCIGVITIFSSLVIRVRMESGTVNHP
jgi:MFS family permease